MNLKEYIEREKIGEIKLNEELKNHTTYKIGGICDAFVSPYSGEKLVLLLKTLKENNIKYKVLGNGSNVIISSKRYKGVIICLNKLNKIEFNDEIVNVGAGVLTIKLSNMCANNNLGGFEFASGIPASIGGAVYMNAGAYKSDMSEVLTTVTYIDDDLNIVTKKKEELDFSYRHSVFQEKDYIILEAKIKLHKANKNEILTLMNTRRQKRIESQPLEYPSAGSVFRNPSDTVFSGKLIEDLGLKGYTIGGAKISDKHANFIINYNDATAEDIVELINYIKEKVKEKYNIELKVEQEFVNFEG